MLTMKEPCWPTCLAMASTMVSSEIVSGVRKSSFGGRSLASAEMNHHPSNLAVAAAALCPIYDENQSLITCASRVVQNNTTTEMGTLKPHTPV